MEPRPRDEPLLSVRDLTAHFDTDSGTVTAVRGVGLTVRYGEVVGVVGESGCGKSTLVRSLLGLVEPSGHITSGSVQLNGEARDLLKMNRSSLRKLRGADIGYVGQNPFAALNPILRIDRQFRNAIVAHKRATKRSCSSLAQEMLLSVGIARPERVLKGYAHQLSGGMIQRVVIALAFILDPRLVIADEPTTGLDATVQRQVLDLIRRLAKRDDRGMLLVTHDLGAVAQYCDRVLVMYAGRIVESGSVAAVFSRPAHPYTMGLLNSIPGSKQHGERLSGTVADIVNPPAGCSFHPRCPYAFERCDHLRPDIVRVASDQAAACWLEGGVSHYVAHSS